LLLLLVVLAVAATFVRGAGHRADAGATPRPADAIAATPAPQPATVAPSPARAALATPTKSTATSEVASAPGEAGMRIYLDPETGTFGPPPAGAEPVGGINPLNDSDAGLVQVRLPDGSYMVDLEGRFQEYYVVQMTPSGKRVVKCVQDPKQVPATSAAVPQPEER
jgi:hypothetical protein